MESILQAINQYPILKWKTNLGHIPTRNTLRASYTAWPSLEVDNEQFQVDIAPSPTVRA